MMQILAVLTEDYVVVASDRQLTFADGTIAHDNTCKLVSLCGVAGIAYTGWATLEGSPTHEWIAKKLAENKCRHPGHAAVILQHAAPAAVRALKPLEQTFLVAGWATTSNTLDALRPHFWLVTNALDRQRKQTPPGGEFHGFRRVMAEGEGYVGQVIGKQLGRLQRWLLHRSVRRMVKHRTGPKPVLTALVREIVNSAGNGVGDKVLGFCIPRAAAKQTYQSGTVMVLASEPDLQSATFCYFDKAILQAKQYGPSFACGGSVITGVETHEDPSRDFQSVEIRILHLPN